MTKVSVIVPVFNAAPRRCMDSAQANFKITTNDDLTKAEMLLATGLVRSSKGSLRPA